MYGNLLCDCKGVGLGGGGGGLLNILQVTHLTFCLPKFPQNVMFWGVLDFLLRTPPLIFGISKEINF